MPSAYIENFNRYGTVPFALSNGQPIFESAIIAQYIDSKFGGGALFRHNNPEEAALAQLLAAKFEAGPFYRVLGTFNDENVASLKELLGEVERIYREDAAAYRTKGPYLLGDKLSSAEILTATVLYRFEILLQHFRKFDLLEGFPLLKAALKAVLARPAFQATSRGPEVYIEHFAKFVK
ncbi:Aste57867_5242 [Aphanomyces stellatus]|uniref:Aste57867_5242 protein n=1 Tax=Aphanomyces stellatus TaxID=120398 RepID=A0A485KF93_9STRA|nr:hypothetical protein As57867_005229 [Aphanomyces stellatus]VFT82315.1 Aste57867_5242 [Aphanomyces stellatus]